MTSTEPKMTEGGILIPEDWIPPTPKSRPDIAFRKWLARTKKAVKAGRKLVERPRGHR
jgi:hypothetical protein